MSNGGARSAVAWRRLRRVVGALGVLLPLVLVLGDTLLNPRGGLPDSISGYYGTPMRNVLVGVLFSIAWFLLTYPGYDLADDVAGHLACMFALGVALFPITNPSPAVKVIHGISAGLLFLVLSYFSLILFTKTRSGNPPSPRKKARNRVYVVCGIVMLACIALIGAYEIARALGMKPWEGLKPVFWLESLALWAFGVSWFVKGDTVLRDIGSAASP